MKKLIWAGSERVFRRESDLQTFTFHKFDDCDLSVKGMRYSHCRCRTFERNFDDCWDVLAMPVCTQKRGGPNDEIDSINTTFDRNTSIIHVASHMRQNLRLEPREQMISQSLRDCSLATGLVSSVHRVSLSLTEEQMSRLPIESTLQSLASARCMQTDEHDLELTRTNLKLWQSESWCSCQRMQWRIVRHPQASSLCGCVLGAVSRALATMKAFSIPMTLKFDTFDPGSGALTSPSVDIRESWRC